MPTVTIDGIAIEVAEGATVLDAANLAGVWIPTLCFHPAIHPPATCRICMVELDRGDWTQLITACNYPVRRDLVISTTSEQAVKARQGVMKLILARAPDNEELTALAKRMGVDGTPFPTVTNAQRDCILCGLCTAVCEEVLGRAAIGMAGRGPTRAVATPFRLPSPDCIVCGACAVVCPVGTIQVRVHPDKNEAEISPFKTRSKLVNCDTCGARVLSVPASREALKRTNVDWEEFRRRAKLCPSCRRREAAAAIALVPKKD